MKTIFMALGLFLVLTGCGKKNNEPTPVSSNGVLEDGTILVAQSLQPFNSLRLSGPNRGESLIFNISQNNASAFNQQAIVPQITPSFGLPQSGNMDVVGSFSLLGVSTVETGSLVWFDPEKLTNSTLSGDFLYLNYNGQLIAKIQYLNPFCVLAIYTNSQAPKQFCTR